MRKLCGLSLCLSLFISYNLSISNSSCLYAQEGTTISEEAQTLYEEAIEFQKNSKMSEAIESYIKALRKDRSILAYDDNGLIDTAYKTSVAKLKESPEDLKLLEVCGFLASVGLSDNETAVGYYQKIIDLVEDEKVKERTKKLIERLNATAIAQDEYDREAASSLREERLKTWAEYEKADSFAQEQAKANEISSKLNSAYSNVESLQNKIPQIEDELKDLKESYDKANRLWYAVKDELYERRRRRLKHDIEAKENELNSAKQKLSSAQKTVSRLEKEDEQIKAKIEGNSSNTENTENIEDDDSAFNSDNSNLSNNSDYGDEPSDSYENSDEEDDDSQNDDSIDEERSKQIDELIDEI